MDDEEEAWTRIRINAPLPMGVAGALISMIGAAWPDSKMETHTSYSLSFLIPKKRPQNVDEEFLGLLGKQATEPETDGEFLGEFLGWDGGMLAFAPPEELCLHLGNVAHAIMKSHEPAAVNHVEWTILTGTEEDDPSYVLSVSRSKQQTPLAMRLAAEKEVKRLSRLLRDHGIDPA